MHVIDHGDCSRRPLPVGFMAVERHLVELGVSEAARVYSEDAGAAVDCPPEIEARLVFASSIAFLVSLAAMSKMVY